MSIILLKARVKLIDESDYEWDTETYGERKKENPIEWGWREKVINTNNFYDLTELTPYKTIILFYDDTELIVRESIRNLYNIWKKHLEGETINLEEISSETGDGNINAI